MIERREHGLLRRVRGAIVAATTLAAVLGVGAGLRAAEPAEVAKDIDSAPGRFIRVSDDDGVVALQIAARRFRNADGEGPAVTLFGIVHVGDGSYYRTVQDLLADYDVVLYESVKPAGAGGAGGDTHVARVESTRAALGFIASLVELHHAATDRYPEDIAAARAFVAERDPRLADFLDVARVDAWGGLIDYARTPDADAGYRLRSFGADGRAGGDGVNADVELDEPVPAYTASGADDNLQVQLANALALSFQLDAIDYGAANWRCSDMSIDQLDRAMRERGADFTVVESTLAGSTLPAKIARFMLGLVRVADAFTDGAISDMLKVLIIEMLGDEAIIEQSLNQFDEGFTQVIIDDRNQVVVDDLQRIIADEDVDSVAVLYGAGHMRDLAARLDDQLGYRPDPSARWLSAIEVNLAESAATEAEMRQLRAMVRQMMRQMGGGRD
jgi:hypothetical protein